MNLTYRGISYNRSSDTQATTSSISAKYRGLNYTVTPIPASLTGKVLKYRGITYVTDESVAYQSTSQDALAKLIPAFP